MTIDNSIAKKVILSVDTSDIKEAMAKVNRVKDYIFAIKLGLEFFVSQGPQGIKKMQELNLPIFLDLKLHDIPNTVHCAVKEAVKLGVFMLTIHCQGGAKMLEKAAQIAAETAAQHNVAKPLLLGVTIMTSLDKNDINNIGLAGDVEKNVLNLANLAQKSGLDGIVCSAHEIKAIKQNFGDSLKLVTPGIRFANSDSNDQKRIMTPKQAIDLGADYLVIGRSIMNSDIEIIKKELL